MSRNDYTSVFIRREMTITHDDFFRLLPKALAEYQFKIAGNIIKAETQSGSVDIQLMQEVSKAVGALTLPVTQVILQFENTPQDEIKLFFKKFDSAYQKGGG